ncbi:MAG: hypothetical protein EPO61_07950 [Nitrospirae bacterium]|nr:MAG: hypothetical protein EPO61_07950 [Nitrospirota bacterium]
MSETDEQAVRQAIATLSQADPIPKLLQQVKLGKMKPTDAGLRAITEAWLGTYRHVIERGLAFDATTLRRLDPSPRLAVLIEAGVLADDHAAVASLRKTFDQALAGAK